MPNPSLPSRPYLEFAERCSWAVHYSEPVKWQDEGGRHEIDLEELLETAERHALLLETIREWADTNPSYEETEGGYSQARSDVRSLIDQGRDQC